MNKGVNKSHLFLFRKYKTKERIKKFEQKMKTKNFMK